MPANYLMVDIVAMGRIQGGGGGQGVRAPLSERCVLILLCVPPPPLFHGACPLKF